MIFSSPYPSIDIPEMPLPAFVLQHAAQHAEKAALIDGLSGRTITYGQLALMVQQAASGFAQRGLKKGEVVAIVSPNIPEYAIVYHAIASLGAVNTTVNPLSTVHELHHHLLDAEASYLVTISPLVEKAQQAVRETAVREIIVIGEAEGYLPFSSLLVETLGSAPDVEIDPHEDVVALPYSSGTTGLPKGVMLTHYNLVSNVCQVEHILAVGSDDILAAVIPFFHIYGQSVFLNHSLYIGATIVTLPRFDLEQFLAVLQNYRVTCIYSVPLIIQALAKHPLVDSYDLSHLKNIYSGATTLSQELVRCCKKRLGCVIRQAYGMTESSPATHMDPLDPTLVRANSIGPCIPNTTCKIVDTEQGTVCDFDERGEIYVRGPQVMKGYLHKEQETAAMIDSEGWLHTGDVGYVDSDGYLHVVDRLKEMIRYKSYQIAPAELEAVLLTHHAVVEAAVIGCPDEEVGEIPKGYVVCNQEITADVLMHYVAERVAPYKKIRRIEFVQELPKLLTGKILRRVLVERERAARLAATGDTQ